MTASTAESRPGPWRAIIVTLAAVAIFIAARRVPVPGLDPDALADLSRSDIGPSAVARLSIVGLGIMPLLNALILAELCRLLVPGLWRNTPMGPAPLAVLIIAFLFAAFQAYGITVALQQFPHLVPEPGGAFTATVMATVVTGFALAAALAKIVTRYGIGNGLWVLFVTPVLAGLPFHARGLAGLAERGEIASAAFVTACAIPLISIAALVALLSRREGVGVSRIDDIVWPPILAGALAGWLQVIPWLFSDGETQQAYAALVSPGSMMHATITALLTLGFVTLYALHTEHGFPVWFTAAVLAAVVFVPELAASRLGVPPLVDGRLLVVVVAVLFSFASLWARTAPPDELRA